MASDEYLARFDEHLRRGSELMEQIRAEAAERESRNRADAAEREQRYREEVAITREVIRRNEIAFREGSRLHATLIESLRELRAEIREDRRQAREDHRQMREDAKAHTQAILRLLDRFGGKGPEPAGA